MKNLSFTIVVPLCLFVWFSVSPAHGNRLFQIGAISYISSGSYHIEETEKGLFLVTERQWAWMLTDDNHFKPGETGLYYIDRTSNPPRIITDKTRSFYITNLEILNELTLPTQFRENDLIYHIIGNEALVSSKWSPSHVYKTDDEARRGQKGEATLQWERRKAEEQVRLEAERRAKQEAKAKADAEARNRQALENLRKMVEQRQQVEYEKCLSDCVSYGNICMTGCSAADCGTCFYLESECKKRCR